MKNTILVVDYTPQTYKILDIVLDKDDFEIVECCSGRQAIRLCVSIKPSLIVLDPDMPDMAGADIIKSLREWSQIPIIILSTHKGDEDVINTLDMGADDYVTKPFNADVLRARINAALRKSAIQETGKAEIFNGPLRMDLVRHQVFLGNDLISFTPKEYSLLRYFITHCGKMLSHRQILNEVWGGAHSEDKQYLRVFIGQIREKIEKQDPTIPAVITTASGIGYRMELLQSPLPHKQGEFAL